MSVSLKITHDLDRLANTLGAIARETGKDARRLVADATVQFLLGGNGVTGMARRAKTLAPKKGEILAEAEARNFRVSIFHQRAKERAFRAFRGQQSQSSKLLFRTRADRVSAKTPGVIRRGRLIRIVADRDTGKFRNARSLAARAQGDSLFEKTVTALQAKRVGRRPKNTVALNLRALEVYHELKARESSRAYSSSAYAFAGVRALRGRDSGAADFVRRSAAGHTIGTVRFRSSAKDSAAARITNFIPTRRHDTDALSAATLGEVLRDKEQYLARKILQNFNRIRK